MKWKLWLNIVTLGALVLLIILARHDIYHAILKVKELNWLVLLLIIPALFLSFYTLGKSFALYFKATGQELSMKVLMPAMIELNFINHVFPSGGVSGASYFAWRVRPYGMSTAKSTLAQLTRFSFAFVGYIGLMLVSLLLLAIEGHASSLIILLVSGVVFSLLFGMMVVVFALGSEKRTATLAQWLIRIFNRIVHVVRPKHPETIKIRKVRKILLELHEDYDVIRGDLKRMRVVFAWNFAASICELSLLYITFVAHGAWVNPGVVVIAFVIATAAGLLAILPGGIGIYEPLMTAVFISVGVPAGLALSVTLIYRTVSLVLGLITGGILYHKALNTYGTSDL